MVRVMVPGHIGRWQLWALTMGGKDGALEESVGGLCPSLPLDGAIFYCTILTVLLMVVSR